MTDSTIIIDSRFRGPPNSGNGGYVCGQLAAFIDGAAAVTLKVPPPLDRPLRVEMADEGGGVFLFDGETPVATAEPATLDLDVPDCPAYGEAEQASHSFSGFGQHIFPSCFVCGPERAEGDGLRIFAGSIEGRAVFAAPWLADNSLAADDGLIDPAHLWAALDCPGYFACAEPGEPALLGRLTGEVFHRPSAGDRCIVAAWPARPKEGRKKFAGTAVFGPGGQLLARAEAVWITISAPLS